MFQNQFGNLSEIVTYILHLCCMDDPHAASIFRAIWAGPCCNEVLNNQTERQLMVDT